MFVDVDRPGLCSGRTVGVRIDQRFDVLRGIFHRGFCKGCSVLDEMSMENCCHNMFLLNFVRFLVSIDFWMCAPLNASHNCFC